MNPYRHGIPGLHSQSTIETLPVEIIAEIASLLDGRLPYLLAFTGSSRHVRSALLSSRFLWQHIDFSTYHNIRPNVVVNDDLVISVLKMVRTPEITIRALTLDYTNISTAVLCHIFLNCHSLSILSIQRCSNILMDDLARLLYGICKDGGPGTASLRKLEVVYLFGIDNPQFFNSTTTDEDLGALFNRLAGGKRDIKVFWKLCDSCAPYDQVQRFHPYANLNHNRATRSFWDGGASCGADDQYQCRNCKRTPLYHWSNCSHCQVGRVCQGPDCHERVCTLTLPTHMSQQPQPQTVRCSLCLDQTSTCSAHLSRFTCTLCRRYFCPRCIWWRFRDVENFVVWRGMLRFRELPCGKRVCGACDHFGIPNGVRMCDDCEVVGCACRVCNREVWGIPCEGSSRQAPAGHQGRQAVPHNDDSLWGLLVSRLRKPRNGRPAAANLTGVRQRIPQSCRACRQHEGSHDNWIDEGSHQAEE